MDECAVEGCRHPVDMDDERKARRCEYHASFYWPHDDHLEQARLWHEPIAGGLVRWVIGS